VELSEVTALSAGTHRESKELLVEDRHPRSYLRVAFDLSFVTMVIGGA